MGKAAKASAADLGTTGSSRRMWPSRRNIVLLVNTAISDSCVTKAIVLPCSPLPPKENEHDRHFDCIGYDDVIRYKLVDSYPVIENAEDNYEIIKRRLNYLTERYYGDNLCILPIVRLDNYKHNFYSMEYYPGIFTYVNAEKEWYVTPIKERHEDKLYDLIISPRYEFDARFSQHLFSSKQDYKNRIIW